MQKQKVAEGQRNVMSMIPQVLFRIDNTSSLNIQEIEFLSFNFYCPKGVCSDRLVVQAPIAVNGRRNMDCTIFQKYQTWIYL